MIKQEK